MSTKCTYCRLCIVNGVFGLSFPRHWQRRSLALILLLMVFPLLCFLCFFSVNIRNISFGPLFCRCGIVSFWRHGSFWPCLSSTINMSLIHCLSFRFILNGLYVRNSLIGRRWCALSNVAVSKFTWRDNRISAELKNSSSRWTKLSVLRCWVSILLWWWLEWTSRWDRDVTRFHGW